MLTDKHFTKVAAIMRNTKPIETDERIAPDDRARYMRRAIITDLANYFRETNQNFDFDRFYEASGLND
jgi:hypothetical protein